MKITFIAAENCFSSGIAGLLDMFSIANMWQASLTGRPEPLFTTEIVSSDGRPVLSSGCIQLLPHRSLAEAEDTDFVMIPPFIPLPNPVTEGTLQEWLILQHGRKIPLAALCTGAFLLAETGLLNGRVATTNWHFARKFRRRFPEVRLDIEQLITEEDGLICTGAATAHYNLGLRLIDRYGSKELAAICAKALLIDPRRDSQAPYFMHRREEHNDAEMLKAQRYFEENYGQNIRIDEVADHVRISPRHFKRRFQNATGYTPISYLQMVRLEIARQKLESTLESIEEITRQIGYEDSSTFRRLFKSHTKLSPREYRDKFLYV